MPGEEEHVCGGKDPDAQVCGVFHAVVEGHEAAPEDECQDEA
ncbi:hypothetical protein [Arthrobacter sp. NIO-1057]|nr:hypothetical protein [Arthrobacter sp. NIO-1057]